MSAAAAAAPDTAPAPALRDKLADARLYLCCDAREKQGDLPEFLDAVLSGGVDIVQLRQKGIEARQEMAALEVFADACRRHGTLLAVNDRADVALGAGADVLHLGQDDLPVPLARRDHRPGVADRPLLPRRRRSRRRGRGARRGLLLHRPGLADPDQTRPPRPRPGPGRVRGGPARRGARPWFAIGGIDAGNLGEVLDAGARRVVVVRALTEAADPHAAAAELSGMLRG